MGCVCVCVCVCVCENKRNENTTQWYGDRTIDALMLLDLFTNIVLHSSLCVVTKTSMLDWSWRRQSVQLLT